MSGPPDLLLLNSPSPSFSWDLGLDLPFSTHIKLCITVTQHNYIMYVPGVCFRFPGKHFGTMIAFSYVCGGMSSLLSYPLVLWLEDGHFGVCMCIKISCMVNNKSIKIMLSCHYVNYNK